MTFTFRHTYAGIVNVDTATLDGRLLVFVQPLAELSEDVWKGFMSELRRLMRYVQKNRVRYGILYDINVAIKASQVTELVYFHHQHRPFLEAHMIGTFIITHSERWHNFIAGALSVLDTSRPIRTILRKSACVFDETLIADAHSKLCEMGDPPMWRASSS